MGILFLLTMSASVLHASPASPERWYFTHFTTDDGLAFNSVTSITQDSNGFVWFATEDGLSRYDGRDFKNFTKDDLGIDTDFITALCADGGGNLWVGSDNGASRYDFVSDSFVPLDAVSDKGTEVRGKVTHICIDDGGLVWMSVNGLGLFSYDPVTDRLRNFFCENGRTTLPFNIRTFVIDGNGDFWLSLYFADIWYSDSSLQKAERVKIVGWKENDDIVSMDRNGQGRIILSSWKNGLGEFDCKKRSFRSYLNYGPGQRPKGMYYDRNNRRIWSATTRGLCLYDLATGETARLSSNVQDGFSLSGDNITAVFTDATGGLWASSLSSGVNYASEYHKNFRKYYMADGENLAGCFIMDIAQDSSGRIWVASEKRGLLYLDTADDALHFFRSHLPTNIRSLCSDGDDLWIGAWGGIWKLNTRNGRVSHYFEMRDNAHRLYKTSSGDVLLGFPLGLMRYDRDGDSFVRIPEFDGMYVTGITETFSGQLWVSTYADGIFRYDFAGTGELVHYGYGEQGSRHIPVDKFMCIYEDSKGGIWAGSYGEGFLRYDRQCDSFRNYDSAGVLPSRIAYSMVEGQDGRMWVATSRGIVSFTYPSTDFRFWTTADGLLDNMVEGHTALVTADGTFYFSSNNGLVCFNPDEFFSVNRVPPIVLTDFTINESVVRPGADSPLSENIDLMREIVLQYNQNSFGASVSLLGMASPASSECLYMLEGYDGGWRQLGPAGYFRYTSVPAGTYTLRVKGVDGNGVWNETHPPLKIVVKEVFYRTTEAYIAYGLFFLILLVVIIRLSYRMAVTRERKSREKERIAREQELFQEKITFFYNIIHEIKTPLTLIRTPLQNIMTAGDLSDELRDDLTVIGNNTDYLDRLVKELLDFVRVEENGWVLEYRKVDVVEKLDFLKFNFQETMRAKNIAISFDHTEPHEEIWVDEAALLKILNNLLHNAVKYAETYIRISLTADSDGITVSFRNDGPTIPPERREEIFKPFVQYSDERHPYSQSFGIGLPLARNLAQMHGGSLTLGDEPGCTDFILRLPSNADKAGAPEDAGSQPLSSVETTDTGRLTLLVVEDNDDLLSYLSRKLSATYRVITSPSAEQAVILLEQNDIDIVLTDIALGGMSGIELCRKITSNFATSHIPVVILSAISSTKTKIACMESGASLYIEKPFSLDYLLGSLEVIARKREALKTAHLSGQKVHQQDFDITTGDEEFLAKIDSLIMENLSDTEFGNDELAERLCLSKSTLIRKTKGLLGTTPNDYIRTKRLNIAAAMLSKGSCRINEVCYAVGFNTPSYFTKCFKRQFGMQPAEYMKEHSRNGQTTSEL